MRRRCYKKDDQTLLFRFEVFVGVKFTITHYSHTLSVSPGTHLCPITTPFGNGEKKRRRKQRISSEIFTERTGAPMIMGAALLLSDSGTESNFGKQMVAIMAPG